AKPGPRRRDHRRRTAAGLVRLDRRAGGAGRCGGRAARPSQSGPDHPARGELRDPERAMRGRIAFFAAVFVLALIATLPLRVTAGWLGLDARGLAAREAAGSVWSGRLNDAQLGRAPRGDLSARLRFLRRLTGRARVALARPGEVDPFEGALTVSPSGFGVDDITGRLRVAALFAPLPISAIDLDGVSAGFA